MKSLGDIVMQNFEFLFKELNTMKDALMDITLAKDEPVASMRATLALIDSNKRMKGIISDLDEERLDRLAESEPRGDA